MIFYVEIVICHQHIPFSASWVCEYERPQVPTFSQQLWFQHARHVCDCMCKEPWRLSRRSMCHACFILFLGNTFGSIARGCKGVFEYVLVFNFLIFSTKVTFWCQLHGYFHPCRIHVLQHQSCRISLLRNMWKRLATKKLLFRTPFSEAGSSSGLGHEPRVFSAVR